MGKILLLLVGIVIGVLIARMMMRRDSRDLRAPPPPRIAPPRPGSMDDAEVIELLRQGRKIEAIKRLRERTGLGLAEAKDAVDELEKGLR